mgnify:CR=1 FL=1
MKIRRIIINIIFILFFTLILSKNNTVFAAVSISASANKSSVNINETVAVSITATGGEGYVNISVQNGSADQSRVWASSQSTTVNCTASSNPGKMVINISGVIADSETNVDENVEYPPIEIEVVNPQPEQPTTEPEQPSQPTQEPEQPATTTKSSEARLRDFGIRPKEYDFTGFKSNTYEYSVEVPNDVTEVTVYAVPRDDKATATGAGKISLKEGENTAKVVVTAEDGKTTKEYTLTITRTPSEQPAENPTDTTGETTPTEDPNATETPDNTETEDTFGLESLSIKNFSISPKFSTDEYEYTVGVTEDLSSLEIEAKANKENATVEILGNENLQQGENTITILVTDQETEQTATYQIVVNKNSNAEVVAQVNWLDPSTWGTQQIIIVVVVIVLILVIVGVIIAKVKLAKRDVDEELEFPGADELDKAMAEHQELSDEDSFPYKSAEGNNEFEKDFMSNSNSSSNEEKYSSDSLFDNSTINTENDNVTTNDYYNNHDDNMHTYDEKESKYHLFDDVPSTSNDNDLNDYDTSSRRKGKHF